MKLFSVINKATSKKYKLIFFLLLLICFAIVGRRVYKNYSQEPLQLVKDFYNNPQRSSFNWRNWDESTEYSYFDLVKLENGDIFKPTYTLVLNSPPPVIDSNGLVNVNQKFTDKELADDDRSRVDTISMDVIHFKRNILGKLEPLDLILGYHQNISYNGAVKLAKEKDISQINAGLKEDDPRYDKNIKTFKNPTKEEWMQKLEDQKAKLFHSIPNPSGTDALEYYSSKAYDGDPSFHALKSEGPNDLYKKYFITFNTEFIEDFSVWINDDEFICDVKKPRPEYEDPITQTKEFKEFYETHKNGLYAFNTKTKTLRLFADVRYDEKKGEHFDRYFITNAKNIVIMSNTTMYEYDRNGNFMSSQKIPEQPIMSSGLKEN